MNAEEYLSGIPMWTRKKNTLEDVRAYLEAMGNPDRALKAIHVAGTNGKGSVCAFLTSVLVEAGLHTGTFISPHLTEVRERFLIDGRMVDRESFEKSFQAVYFVTQDMVGRGYCHPTFFEFCFYMAMVLFRDKQVDISVLETGMGWRLDTTNVIERPLACVITSISLDHTQYLGDTIPAIAGEKAGIIKRQVPVVFDSGQSEASQVILRRAEEMEAPAFPVGTADFQILDETEAEAGGGFRLRTSLFGDKAHVLTVPFAARYQAENAALAVRTLAILRGEGFPVGERALLEGIRKTRWPGRMEQVLTGGYLDGAHNPGGIAAFVQAVRDLKEKTGRRAYLLFAVVSDKDYHGMVESLCQDVGWEAVGIARMESSRGMNTEALAQEFKRHGGCPVREYPDAASALEEMRRTAEGELLFCAGSLYLIGELRNLLKTADKE